MRDGGKRETDGTGNSLRLEYEKPPFHLPSGTPPPSFAYELTESNGRSLSDPWSDREKFIEFAASYLKYLSCEDPGYKKLRGRNALAVGKHQ